MWGESWWEEDNPLNLLHGSLTPGRFAYFRKVLGETVGRDHHGLRALDVGSGGGFLAEEFTRIGFRVTGIDPSPVSVDTARRHAAGSALDIEYRIGSGEQLPVPDAAFDVIYCCDVLEHVSDLDGVIAETSRALKPGGLYLFDTINRTFASKLVAIKIMQEWRMTRMFDTPIHDWSMCIRPRGAGADHGAARTAARRGRRARAAVEESAPAPRPRPGRRNTAQLRGS